MMAFCVVAMGSMGSMGVIRHARNYRISFVNRVGLRDGSHGHVATLDLQTTHTWF